MEHRPYGLAACVATDGVVYKDQVLAAAHTHPPPLRHPYTPSKPPPPPPLTVEFPPEDTPADDGTPVELDDMSLWERRPEAASSAATATEATAGSAAAAATTAVAAEPPSETPFHAVLILIPLRLGLQAMNEIYEGALKVGAPNSLDTSHAWAKIPFVILSLL